MRRLKRWLWLIVRVLNKPVCQLSLEFPTVSMLSLSPIALLTIPRCQLKIEVKAHEHTEKGGCKNWVKILFIYLHFHINSFNGGREGAPQSNMLQFKYPTCLSNSPNVVFASLDWAYCCVSWPHGGGNKPSHSCWLIIQPQGAVKWLRVYTRKLTAPSVSCVFMGSYKTAQNAGKADKVIFRLLASNCSQWSLAVLQWKIPHHPSFLKRHKAVDRSWTANKLNDDFFCYECYDPWRF